MHTFKKPSRVFNTRKKNLELNKIAEQLDELNKMKLYLERMIEISKILDELYLDEDSKSITCSYEELVETARELNSKSVLQLNEKMLNLVVSNYNSKYIEEYIYRKNQPKEYIESGT